MVVSESVLYVVTANNLYNIKLIVLSILFFYSALGFLYFNVLTKDKKRKDESYVLIWIRNLSKVFSYGFLIFSPLLFMFLLHENIGMELFVTILIALYLMFVGLFIGLSLMAGTEEIFRMFGFDSWNDFKDKRKEKLSLKKYG